MYTSWTNCPKSTGRLPSSKSDREACGRYSQHNGRITIVLPAPQQKDTSRCCESRPHSSPWHKLSVSLGSAILLMSEFAAWRADPYSFLSAMLSTVAGGCLLVRDCLIARTTQTQRENSRQTVGNLELTSFVEVKIKVKPLKGTFGPEVMSQKCHLQLDIIKDKKQTFFYFIYLLVRGHSEWCTTGHRYKTTVSLNVVIESGSKAKERASIY